MTNFENRLSHAVVSIEIESAAVHEALQAHATVTSAGIGVAKEVLADFLDAVPGETTQLTLPEELATNLADIWAAKYAWSDPAHGWHRFTPFVNLLLDSTDWHVEPHHTSEPNPRDLGDEPIIIQLHRFGT